ncbi:MAG: hypothetical protein M3066_19250 [Actinomycetota bacterium]|nr:hypothetical protein [Actinomycetota bacterium]
MTSSSSHPVRWDRDPARLATGVPERQRSPRRGPAFRVARLAATRHKLKQGWAGAPRRGRPRPISGSE